MRSCNGNAPRMLFPIIIFAVLAFMFYAIVDSAMRYGNISQVGIGFAFAVIITLMALIVRFRLRRYEYLLVGDELIIRRRTPRNVMGISSFVIADIELVTKSVGIKRFTRKNRCNSLKSALLGGCLMCVSQGGKHREVVVELPSDIARVVKLNLEERYTA
ncbi:MAG: hypothetical protein RSA70_05195 [Clostridia bacterium]